MKLNAGVVGVYYIKSLVDGKLYIGKSKNIYERFLGHFKLLKKSKHYNKHLQSSYNLYGRDNFITGIIETCDESDLDEREAHFIRINRSLDERFGFNFKCGGEGGHFPIELRNHLRAFKVCKPVYGFTLDGVFSKKWDSISQCATELGCSPCDIRRTINLVQRYCKGYALSFDKKFNTRNSKRGVHLTTLFRKVKIKNIKKNKAKKGRGKIVLDLNTGIYYNNAREASELLGHVHSTLKSKLNGACANNTSLKYV